MILKNCFLLCIVCLTIFLTNIIPTLGQDQSVITPENANTLTYTRLFMGGYIADIDLVGDLVVIGSRNGISTYSVSDIRTMPGGYQPIRSLDNTGTSQVALHPNGKIMAISLGGIPDKDALVVIPPEALYNEFHEGYGLQEDFGLVSDIMVAADETVYMASTSTRPLQ